MLLSVGAFARQYLTENSKKNTNLPNHFYLLTKHLKFMLYSNKEVKNKEYFSDSIGKFNVTFPSYSELDTIFNEIFIYKDYFFESKTSEPLIIDCGSNIGISVLFFKLLYPNSKILAFEPSQKNFEMLETNINNNRITNIKLYKKALSNKKEKTKFYNSASIVGTLFSSNQNETKYEIVETALLSDFINQKTNLLKLDIEGAEDNVITDLDQNNKLTFIDKIIMEYHDPIKKNNLSKVLKILEKNKFYYQIKSHFKTPFNSQNKDMAYLIYAYKNQ